MNLTADKARWYEDHEGFWLAVRTKDRAAAAQIAQKMDEPWTIEAKKKHKRRSLDANAYCWVLLDKLAASLGVAKTDLYRQYVRDIGGNSETVCVVDAAVGKLRDGWEHTGLGWPTEVIPSKIKGCTNVILYYGSSTYDAKQMSRLISLVVDDCKEHGIETMTPFELDALMSRWGDA